MQDLRERIRIVGTWLRDLLNTFRELRDTIRSIDRERIPNPQRAIQALRISVRFVVRATLDELKNLGTTIQNLQNAIDSIRTRAQEQMPSLQNVSGSIAEWWRDLWETCQRIREWLGNNVEGQLTELERRARNIDILTVDRAAEIIAGLGIPGLVLVRLMAASPYFGAAAITSSLAALGPFGMLGGIATLGILAFISRALAEFGVDQLFQAVLIRLKENGETCETILERIEGYPISSELRQRLREFIENFCEGENDEQ
jgi:hypothetical protein